MNRIARNLQCVVLFALAGIVAAALPVTAGAAVVRAADPVPGRYLVVLRESALAPPLGTSLGGPGVAELARSLGAAHRADVGRRFESALVGFVATLDADDAEQLALDPRVAQVFEDGRVTAAQAEIAGSWGLDRVDQRLLPLDSRYLTSGTGFGVDLFVVDTGVRSTHHQLAGRVDTTVAFTAIEDGYGTEDCNGHGTHVAGVAAGGTLGIAREATIHPVRVLGCDGRGSVSDVVAGIDWITATRLASQGKGRKAAPAPPAVANLSIEAARHPVLDQAVAASVAAGVTYVVAAGNSGSVACDRSPAGVLDAITVGATDATDTRAAYSNYGRCVDLFAPGHGIVSASILSDEGLMTMSGTSAAAPHVAGVAAVYLADHPAASPAEVATALAYHATSGVANAGLGSPDRLLYSRFATDGIDELPLGTFALSCNIARRVCEFDAAASFDDAGIVSYDWDFGDGDTSRRSDAQPNHRFPGSPGEFLVTLTVTDTAGQTASYQRTVFFASY